MDAIKDVSKCIIVHLVSVLNIPWLNPKSLRSANDVEANVLLILFKNTHPFYPPEHTFTLVLFTKTVEMFF